MSPFGPAALLLLAAFLPMAASGAEPSSACLDAAAMAERDWTLPSNMIAAIGQVESGRLDHLTGRVAPWPWTVNANGNYFATRAEAVSFVRNLQASGVRLIDVGCFQIDLFHHPTAFASLEEAFDPAANAPVPLVPRPGTGHARTSCQGASDHVRARFDALLDRSAS